MVVYTINNYGHNKLLKCSGSLCMLLLAVSMLTHIATTSCMLKMIMMDGNPGDVVAVWQVKLADGPHKIVLEHGGTSGKRVISVDGEEVRS